LGREAAQKDLSNAKQCGLHEDVSLSQKKAARKGSRSFGRTRSKETSGARRLAFSVQSLGPSVSLW
jgi:hypothetical protein